MPLTFAQGFPRPLRALLPARRAKSTSPLPPPTPPTLATRDSAADEAPESSTPFPSHSSASYLLAQAALEDEEETKRVGRRPPLPDPAERPWDGDEPQDRAIRRILADTYKPLRIKGWKKALPIPAPLPNNLFNPPSEPPPTPTPPKHPWEYTFKAPSSAATPSIRSGGTLVVKLPDRRVDPTKRLEAAAIKRWYYEAGFGVGGGARREGTRVTAKGRSPVPVGMRAWGGFVEDKIEQARAEGFFKNVKGRGKPIALDDQQSNPFISRDEFLINRIVQNQGAAPPWVDIQVELESCLTTFRSGLRSSWNRRAIRMLSLEGVSRTSICEIKNGWRDPEWEVRERSYHEKAIAELNSLVRRYNSFAPYSVRRPPLTLANELAACFSHTAPEIEKELVRIMEGGGAGAKSPAKVKQAGGGRELEGEEQPEVKEKGRRLVPSSLLAGDGDGQHYRVCIWGNSGSGKSTLAKRLTALFEPQMIEFDMDAAMWNDGWVKTPHDVMVARMKEFTTGHDDFVTDGNYFRLFDAYGTRVTDFVWLDYPLYVTFWQLVKRTFWRWWNDEVLFGTTSLREDWRTILSTDSIFLWCLTMHKTIRGQVQTKIAERNLTVKRFTSRAETDAWLAGLAKELGKDE